jgi:hypothetical protein
MAVNHKYVYIILLLHVSALVEMHSHSVQKYIKKDYLITTN